MTSHGQSGGRNVTIAVTGTISGEDYLRIFGTSRVIPGGTPFSLVFTFDESKGETDRRADCADGFSAIRGTGANSPGIAVLTIGARSYVFGKRADARSSAWRSVASPCSKSEMGVDITEGKSPLVSQIHIRLVPPDGVRSLTQENDWRSAISLSRFGWVRPMENAFAISQPGNYAAGDRGYLQVLSITVGRSNQKSAAPPVAAASAPVPASPPKAVTNRLPPPPPPPAGTPDVSKIYVLSRDISTVLTTYTPDGRPTTPTIDLDHMNCTGVDVDARGRIYVSNAGPRNSVMIFRPDGTLIQPTLTLNLATHGVKVDAAGAIFVIGTYQHKVLIEGLTPSGAPSGLSIDTGIPTVGGLALDSAGRIYAADKDGDAVKIFDAHGRLLSTIVKSGMVWPTSVAVGPDGKVFVGNDGNVTAYALSGQRTTPTLSQVDKNGLDDTITALAVDSRGRIYAGGRSGSLSFYKPDGTRIGQVIRGRKEIVGIAVR
ncbi:MAG TPA: hypothetical protein VMI94_18580 [Bryobacteraceae bacterium]|nr:hypothetical protein [Bryobacteraceae bacterium]